ncbi:unnamed protein product [Trichogramma brassicae]|uniref:Uncharacterized protein n=1 Tax=Trichogramma brassicae TaxID=86971 RepID=A0A6H5IL99_9HYME|nr:unnamed protein product [Trichogramma brassicae]
MTLAARRARGSRPVIHDEKIVGSEQTLRRFKKYALSSQTYFAEEASRYRGPELLALSLAIISTVSTHDERSENIAVIEAACDTARLVIDAMRDETLIRRSLVLSSINSAVRDTLVSTDPDDWLFGRELSEKLRQAKLTGQDARLLAKKTTSSQLSKNGKPQLRQTYGSKAEAAKGYNRPMSSRTANRRSQRDRAQSPRRNSSKSSYKKDYFAKRRA